MTRYSVQFRDGMFAKGYGVLSFAKNMGKKIGKNIRKNLSGYYSQKLLNYPKQSVTDAFTTASKRSVQKTAHETVDMIG